MRASTLIAILVSAAGSALAHMEMIDPFPILSPANPAVNWDVKNYDMMAPLLWPGDNLPYPCKGYLYSTPASERKVQKYWPAGSWQSVTLGPNGAPHLGGSCQLSLSYDYGRTWQVILSIMGGCPTDSYKMDFQLPAEAPSGEAVFSWSWVNHQGNREYYQNCAIIEVTGGGAGLPTRDYPPPFVANAGVNGCSTIEGVDPVFPNPGKNVRFGGPYRGQVITEQRGITGQNCVDQYAGETPAGSRGRSVAEPITTTTSSSAATSSETASSITSTSTSSAIPTITATNTAETSSTTPSASSTAVSSTTSVVQPETASSSSVTSVSPTIPATTAEPTQTSAIGNQHNASPLPEESSLTPSSSSASTTTMAVVTTTASSSIDPTSTTSVDTSHTSLIETTSSTSSTSSSSTSTALPTLSPGGTTCTRKTKRSGFEVAPRPQSRKRLVRRVVKQMAMSGKSAKKE